MRYFIEVSYKGTRYAGFQTQKNANTIQAEMERALSVYFRSEFSLTGSSRTDAGVHALQNYFHFDTVAALPGAADDRYHLNAILPDDITVKQICQVKNERHCRFDAVSREYRYFIYAQKDPFLQERAYLFPYPLSIVLLQRAAEEIKNHTEFSSFSKRNSQVKSYVCEIMESEWIQEKDHLFYRVKANRFLRGMVRGLVGTMLRVGRGTTTIDEFQGIIESHDNRKVDFSTPACGLFLFSVNY